MSWIKTIPYQQAGQALKRLYDRVKGPNDNVDNVLLIHSLRPHSLSGHLALYKNVLHNAHNTLPKWYLEALGVYVSYLNNCAYCVAHHFAGFKRLINDEKEANRFMEAVKLDATATFYKNHYNSGMVYAKKLTLNGQNMHEADIEALRTAGFDDGQILEINQVVSYFNYVNRTVTGLGVNSEGDILGLSPNDSDDPDNWNHS